MARSKLVAGAVVTVGIVMALASCLAPTSDGASEQVRQVPTVTSSSAAPVQPSSVTSPSSAVQADSLASQPATTSSVALSDSPAVQTPASPTESSVAPPVATEQPAAPTIAPAPPTQLVIPAIGMDIPVGEVASVREGDSWDVYPPEETLEDLQRAYWWSEHQAPGNPASETVFFHMHACKKVACAGDNLSKLVVGDLVQVTTPSGVLTYQVFREPKSFPKSGPDSTGNSPEVYDYSQPGWLTLITCGYSPDGVSDINWVVWTKLV